MPEIIFLSIIQGVTEFIPVSSSAHLILLSNYLNFNNQNLTLDISLHLGSLLAIIFYFKKDLLNLVDNKNLFIKIIISSIPVMFFGFLLISLNLMEYLRSYEIIGWSTVLFALLLYFSDAIKIKKIYRKDFSYSAAIFMGFFQVLSLMPGVSRSGITITAARLLNFSREDSAKISFLISIPVLITVSLYNLQNLMIDKNHEVSLLNFYGVCLSFFFSYITIKFFLEFIKKFTFLPFVIYRVILGLFILAHVYY